MNTHLSQFARTLVAGALLLAGQLASSLAFSLPIAAFAARRWSDAAAEARTLGFLKKAIPDRQSLKAAVTTPIRYAEDGYSWVAKRFAD